MEIGVSPVFLCAALVWLCGCDPTGRHQHNEVQSVGITTTEVTLGDKGRDLAIKSGDRLVIKLEETPATGYRWTLGADVPPILRFIGSRYMAPTGAQLGKPGLSEWTFEAESSGEGQLYLKRSRPWDGSRASSIDFEISIHVMP